MQLLLALTLVGLLTADPTRAATISASGDTLTYAAGTGEQNQVMLKRDGADYVFGDNGSPTPMTAGTGCTTVDDDTVRCSAAGIAKLTVTLGDLGDLFDAASPAFVNSERPLIPVRVDGGPGDDTIFGGFADDVLIGGPGDDGFAHWFSALGNITPTTDSDTFDGGTGTDTVSFCCFEDMSMTLDGVANDGPPGRHDGIGNDVENLGGGWGSDTLLGNAAGNRLDGGVAGTDSLTGLAGDDTLSAGQGALDGGEGEDHLGSFGSMNAGPGDDRVEQPWPGGGSAVSGDMFGGPGDDTLIAGPGDADVIDGGTGVDVVDFSPRSGDHTITLDGLANDGFAGEGDNVLETENLVGGRDANRLVGSPGPNVIEGGPADDVLDGGGGTDTFRGHDGLDVVSYASANDAVEATLDGLANDGVTGEGENVDGFGDVEGLEGGPGNDRLVGDEGGNRLRGGDGDDDLVAGAATDFLYGGAGDDRLQGDEGLDLLAGGAGLDVASYAGRMQPVTVRFDQRDLWGHVRGGNDEDGEFRDQYEEMEGAEGGEAGDTLVGDAGSNILLGSGGGDQLEGAGGADELDGGDGDDRLVGGLGADDLAAGAGSDTIDYANSGPVTVSLNGEADDGEAGEGDNVGNDGDVERIVGSFFADLLLGDAADNVLLGGAGDDAMAGGPGADQLVGGPGNDLAIYSERAEAVEVALDGQPTSGNADDGVAGARDTVGADVEDVWGGDGADRLFGNASSNLLNGGPGADMLVGGAGEDLADYSERDAGVVLAADGRPTSGGPEDGAAGARDTISADIEDLIGGAGPDRLTGTSAENVLIGLEGDDFLDSRDVGLDFDDCGDGNDSANVDALDEVEACERVDRPGASGGGQVPGTGGTPTARTQTVADRARISFKAPKNLAAFLRRGLRPKVHCAAPCRILARVTVSRAVARNLGLPRGAAGKLTKREKRLVRPGDATIVLRVGKKLRARLAKLGSVVVTLQVTVTEEGGGRRVLRKVIRLRGKAAARSGIASRLERSRALRALLQADN